MSDWIRIEDDLPTEKIPCWVVCPWRIGGERGVGWGIAERKNGHWENDKSVVYEGVTRWAYADAPTVAPDGLPFGYRP